jgi:hypothetical protein
MASAKAAAPSIGAAVIIGAKPEDDDVTAPAADEAAPPTPLVTLEAPAAAPLVAVDAAPLAPDTAVEAAPLAPDLAVLAAPEAPELALEAPLVADPPAPPMIPPAPKRVVLPSDKSA